MIVAPRIALASALALLLSSSAHAQANAGVSDERVTLPQAPGSISGVGENATVEGNKGALQYAVSIEVPPGFGSVTPSVGLSYSSTGGASLVGMGWALPSYSIERMTSRGLEKYDLTDKFAVDGASELVQVAQSANSLTYRARFEGGFVRYTWLNPGTGEAGMWKAEYPDGRTAYYGADKSGTAVPSAQVIVPSTAKVFRWHVVLMEDAFGHQMKFTWLKDGTGYPLMDRVEYLYEGALPRHSVRFTYENRTDVLSDARPGFDLQLTKRLKEVRIFSGTTTPEQVRRYLLEYETDQVSGFQTRLKSVTRFGKGDVQYPVKFAFGYSKTLGGTCDTSCQKPFVTSMGMVSGVDFNAGKASMVDINGDAIPDVVFSDTQGRHSFIYGKLDSEGKASFMANPVASTMTTGSSPFVLGDPKTQLLDVNGDGFVDITQAKAPAVLCNNGSGDWVAATVCTASAPSLPQAYDPLDDVIDSAQQDPKYVRFFDYDNDKRIDWLRTVSGGSTTEVLANTTSGFSAVTVDSIGAVFDESPLQLADMNGDGLQDPVQLLVSGASVTVEYKLNLGFGKWSANWVDTTLSGFNASQAAVADLEDINGDGLADIVAVTGNEVSLVLNRGGGTFAPLMTLTTAELGAGSIPVRSSTTTVTYADMNGNGSSDIVWFQSDGSASYLELFPVRPNLISRIENGIGAVQLISYGSSIFEQSRDAKAGKPWSHRVPNASVVVTKVDSYVTLTGNESGGLHEQITFRYHSGFYDGVEKQFRGYEGVERELLSDMAKDSMEPALVVLDFDIGDLDPAFAGRQRKQQAYSLAGASPALLREDRTLLALCPVADVGTTTPKIAWVCDRATTSIVAEGDLAAARTLVVEREFDGYGNVSRETNSGVKNLGTPEAPMGCEACTASGQYGKPCGAMCVGDEMTNEFGYVVPGTDTGGAWQLNKLKRLASGASPTALLNETLTYFDGPDFVGLPAGQLTKGGITRVARRSGMGATDFVDVIRIKRDASGNTVEQLEPNATAGGAGDRRLYTYDPSGLWTTSVEIKLNATRSLKRDIAYDTAFETMSQVSNWYAVVGGTNAAAPQLTRYRYDEHGRLSTVLEPGDTDAAPSTEYQYKLADPASQILALQRSSASSGQDIASATCLDGRGRVFQTRAKVNDTTWQVSGFTEYDSRGAVARTFQPYTSSSGNCEMAPPMGVPFIKSTYDALGRPLANIEPDGSLRRFEYAPLVRRFFDEDDNDSKSPAYNTPTIEELDGLGRLVRLERTGPSAVTRLQYDALGNLFTVTDPGGNQHVQVYDPMGRLTQVTDPNTGVTKMEHDAAGNVLKRTDARNVVVRTQYDALNRPTAQWNEAAETASKITWTYDVADGCTECTHAGGEVVQVDWVNGGNPAKDRFGYDQKGNVLFHERTIDGHPLVVRRKYDGAERQISTVYPGGITIDRKYDGASRVTAMPGYVTQVDYTDRDELKGITYTNGAKSELEYDGRLRLSRLAAKAADASAIFDLSFTRTRRGDITEIADQGTRTGRARHGAKYTYDAWNRVTTAALDGDAATAETLSFTYNTIDNLLSQTSSLAGSRAHVGDLTYETARPNAVVKAGTTTYGYDAAGHLTSRGNAAMEFDHLGRLTRVTRDGAETGTFTFGPGEARVSKREGDQTTWYVSENFEVRDGIAVVYADLGEQRVARVESDALAATVLSDLAPATGSGTLTPKGDGTIDIADAWLAQAASAGVVQLSGGPSPSQVSALLASAARRLLVTDVTYLHQDHLQSFVAATDGKGALVAEQSFYPYGETRSQGAYVDEYGFTGQERDSSTGLYHFDFRDLDPYSGRWAEADPAFEELTPESLRLLGEATSGYAYVGNNFPNVVDPSGLWGKKSSNNPNSNKNKKANNQKNGKKASKSERVVRGLQLAVAIASVVLSLVGAALTYEGTSSVGPDGHVHLDDVGKAGAVVSVAATSTSAVGTLLGASYDTHNAFKSKSEDKTPTPPTQQANPPANNQSSNPPPSNQPTPPTRPRASGKPPLPTKPKPPPPPKPRTNTTPQPGPKPLPQTPTTQVVKGNP